MLKKINPFQKLDLVVHKPSGKRGIVTEVKGHMVTFEVVMPKPANGQIETATYSFKHLTLVMPAAMVVAGAHRIRQQQAARKRLFGRVRRWFARLWKRPPADVSTN